MPWGSIRGHDRVVEDLRRAMALRRFPHAFLFVGPEGIGKRRVARRLAQALLCERNDESLLEPCGACPSCHQVEASTHPDLLEVARPEDRQELPIKAIRDLNHELALKPMRGHRRVAIVDDADDLSEEASNAFLKTLEEPPPGSVLILVGTAAELQLDTILSRCRVLRFDPLSEPDLAAILREQDLAEGTDADQLAKLGEGSVSRALGLADADLAGFRRDLIDAISSPRGFDPIVQSRQLAAFCEEGAKEAAIKRARAQLLIGELARLFRSVLWQTAGLEPPCPDPADRKAVAALAERLEPEDVFVLADRCLDANYHVDRMIHVGMVCDALMHDLGALVNSKA